MARSHETGLQRDAVGLMSVLFMSVTNMAPGAAVAFDLGRAQRDDAGVRSGRKTRRFERAQRAIAGRQATPSAPSRNRSIGAVENVEAGKLVEADHEIKAALRRCGEIRREAQVAAVIGPGPVR